MKNSIQLAILLSLVAAGGLLAARQHGGDSAAPTAAASSAAPAAATMPLAWAYSLPENGGASAAAPLVGASACSQPLDLGHEGGAPLQVAGSSATFTPAQIGDCFAVADWFPGDHPAMPEIVSHGRKPDVEACTFCHYPNGKGRPENAPLAGLPIPYFAKQMSDFKSGLRASAYPPNADTQAMISFAKSITADEVEAAAEYFASLPWALSTKVVESDRAPKTRAVGDLIVAAEGGETESLGRRIVEVPANTEEALLHDPHGEFIAYVPIGSVAKGKDLVQNGGNGETVGCDNCHGRGLTGLGVTAGIAGRSPSYTARQMYDIQRGARKGSWVGPMQDVVAKLTPDDIVAISAYLATLAP